MNSITRTHYTQPHVELKELEYSMYGYRKFTYLEKRPMNLIAYSTPYQTYSLALQVKSTQMESTRTVWDQPVHSLSTTVLKLTGRLIGRGVIRGIVTYNDPDYGPVIRLVVDLNAREALELWLKLVKLIPYTKYGVVIGVRWLGENNVSKDELVDYVVKIMAEGGLRTTALRPLDVVRELRRERGRR
jgi:hypothetical protein